MRIEDILVTRMILSGANQTLNQLRQVGNEFTRLGQQANLSSMLISSGAGVVAESLTMATAAGTFFAAKLGAQYIETENISARVFGNMGKQIEEFSKKLEVKAPINEFEIRKYASQFFNLATSLKISRNEALGMSKNLVQLGIDLSAFHNVDPDRAMKSLQSGLMGNTRAMYGFQVALNQDILKQRAYQMGIAASGSELNKQQKTLAAYAEMMHQTTSAQGDFGRSFPVSVMGQARMLLAQLRKEMGLLGMASSGTLFTTLRALNAGIPALEKFVDLFSKAPVAIQQTAIALTLLSGPMSRLVGGSYSTALAMGTTSKGLLPYAAEKFGGGYLKTAGAILGSSLLFNHFFGGEASAQKMLDKNDPADVAYFRANQRDEIARHQKTGLPWQGAENTPLHKILGQQYQAPVTGNGGPEVDLQDYVPASLPNENYIPGVGNPNFLTGENSNPVGTDSDPAKVQIVGSIPLKTTNDGGVAFGGYRAAGGGTSAGKAYIVGERGPELFMPTSDGKIVPNGALSEISNQLSNVTFGGYRADGDKGWIDVFKSTLAGDRAPLLNKVKGGAINFGGGIAGAVGGPMVGLDPITGFYAGSAVTGFGRKQYSNFIGGKKTTNTPEELEAILAGDRDIAPFGEDKAKLLTRLKNEEAANPTEFKKLRDLKILEREKAIKTLADSGQQIRDTNEAIEKTNREYKAVIENLDILTGHNGSKIFDLVQKLGIDYSEVDETLKGIDNKRKALESQKKRQLADKATAIKESETLMKNVPDMVPNENKYLDGLKSFGSFVGSKIPSMKEGDYQKRVDARTSEILRRQGLKPFERTDLGLSNDVGYDKFVRENYGSSPWNPKVTSGTRQYGIGLDLENSSLNSGLSDRTFDSSGILQKMYERRGGDTSNLFENIPSRGNLFANYSSTESHLRNLLENPETLQKTYPSSQSIVDAAKKISVDNELKFIRDRAMTANGNIGNLQYRTTRGGAQKEISIEGKELIKEISKQTSLFRDSYGNTNDTLQNIDDTLGAILDNRKTARSLVKSAGNGMPFESRQGILDVPQLLSIEELNKLSPKEPFVNPFKSSGGNQLSMFGDSNLIDNYSPLTGIASRVKYSPLNRYLGRISNTPFNAAHLDYSPQLFGGGYGTPSIAPQAPSIAQSNLAKLAGRIEEGSVYGNVAGLIAGETTERVARHYGTGGNEAALYGQVAGLGTGAAVTGTMAWKGKEIADSLSQMGGGFAKVLPATEMLGKAIPVVTSGMEAVGNGLTLFEAANKAAAASGRSLTITERAELTALSGLEGALSFGGMVGGGALGAAGVGALTGGVGVGAGGLAGGLAGAQGASRINEAINSAIVGNYSEEEFFGKLGETTDVTERQRLMTSRQKDITNWGDYNTTLPDASPGAGKVSSYFQAWGDFLGSDYQQNKGGGKDSDFYLNPAVREEVINNTQDQMMRRKTDESQIQALGGAGYSQHNIGRFSFTEFNTSDYYAQQQALKETYNSSAYTASERKAAIAKINAREEKDIGTGYSYKDTGTSEELAKAIRMGGTSAVKTPEIAAAINKAYGYQAGKDFAGADNSTIQRLVDKYAGTGAGTTGGVAGAYNPTNPYTFPSGTAAANSQAGRALPVSVTSHPPGYDVQVTIKPKNEALTTNSTKTT